MNYPSFTTIEKRSILVLSKTQSHRNGAVVKRLDLKSESTIITLKTIIIL